MIKANVKIKTKVKIASKVNEKHMLIVKVDMQVKSKKARAEVKIEAKEKTTARIAHGCKKHIQGQKET